MNKGVNSVSWATDPWEGAFDISLKVWITHGRSILGNICFPGVGGTDSVVPLSSLRSTVILIELNLPWPSENEEDIEHQE